MIVRRKHTANFCQRKRAEAIAFGAEPITQREAVRYRRIVEGQRP